jgi:hypothetical protein
MSQEPVALNFKVPPGTLNAYVTRMYWALPDPMVLELGVTLVQLTPPVELHTYV